MGSLSPVEALRAVVAFIGLWGAIWGYGRSPDGSLAFPEPIRDRMIRRRRTQMTTYARVFVALLVGAVTAGLIDSPLTIASVVANAVAIYIAIELMVLSFRQSLGWVEFERIVGDVPLVPNAEDALIQASVEAREIMHDIDNELAKAVGRIDLLQLRPDISDAARTEIEKAISTLVGVSVMQSSVHILMRSQSEHVKAARGTEGLDAVSV